MTPSAAQGGLKTGIVWFRQDLRLSDNPALRAACAECDQLLPLFIDDPADQTVSRVGGASRVWLNHSLNLLREQLQLRELDLIIRQGSAQAVLADLIDQFPLHSVAIYWNRCYDPVTRQRDVQIKTALQTVSEVKSFNGLLLFEPWEALKSDATPYRVFTPFYRNIMSRLTQIKALAVPRTFPPLAKHKKFNAGGMKINDLQLLPDLPWATTMMQGWSVGEEAARKRLNRFIGAAVEHYATARDLPAVDGTSRMSPHLHFGEISPRQIIATLNRRCDNVAEHGSGPEILAREVVWREFAYQLLFHFPQMVSEPLDQRFKQFPWARANKKNRLAWQQGRTGVPIIDAGMRQLWQTGWMHNRVRMIVGSYLVKNLLIDWRVGENWFRDTLVDADMASNAMGWQWVAGSGADAAPFFRVFNPVLQGEKFDPAGEYVRKWVPELAELPDSHIHKPWLLAPDQLPKNYPQPLVNLKESRARALLSFDQVKSPLKIKTPI